MTLRANYTLFRICENGRIMSAIKAVIVHCGGRPYLFPYTFKKSLDDFFAHQERL